MGMGGVRICVPRARGPPWTGAVSASLTHCQSPEECWTLRRKPLCSVFGPCDPTLLVTTMLSFTHHPQVFLRPQVGQGLPWNWGQETEAFPRSAASQGLAQPTCCAAASFPSPASGPCSLSRRPAAPRDPVSVVCPAALPARAAVRRTQRAL